MNRIARLAIIFLALVIGVNAHAQKASDQRKMISKVEKFLEKYKSEKRKFKTKMLDINVNDSARTISITADDEFADQIFTHPKVNAVYSELRKKLPKVYRDYTLTIITRGKAIEDYLMKDDDSAKSRKPQQQHGSGGFWGNIDYDGNPWVTNMSRPYDITKGLAGRHLSIWASHGIYYSAGADKWKWQRPELFTTAEDLFTSTFTAPYLIPMLENAGAIVFTPRERDWQTNEVIVDNDSRPWGAEYAETTGKEKWEQAPEAGFAFHGGVYFDGENPFTAGTARMVATVKKSEDASIITYRPNIPKAGRYAVYVSYKTLDGSVDDASYTVVHKGVQTIFMVNQTMGGGTWVYLGTFDFDEGCSDANCVVLSNISGSKGVVTADAVRFGGGMGNISRGGVTSGMPRFAEGSRYYAQWAGMPYETYSIYKGEDDYKDDINSRSTMTNYLGGGSPFMPTRYGLKVPIELTLAIHSDAGYAKDGKSLYGSLSIYTTDFNDGLLDAGVSRDVSGTLARALLTNLTTDISYKFGKWNTRGSYDRNYSETRLPAVPSAILETLSHQNFPDIAWGMDPNFRFTFCRSVYKTLLRFICNSHNIPYVVTPLTPANFRVSLNGSRAMLQWEGVADPQETSAAPTGFIVYTAEGDGGFDNGVYVKNAEYVTDLNPDVVYSFKVVAANEGGISFPTETLCARYSPDAVADILIIDGFHRLSAPAIVDDSLWQGFDINEDIGVPYGGSMAFTGAQLVFDKMKMGGNGSAGMGFSGNELSGQVVAGNDGNHVRTHADAIAAAGKYNIVSASSYAVEKEKTDITRYPLVDLVLGLERNDGHSLLMYEALPKVLRLQLRTYKYMGGALMVSGAYVTSDDDSSEGMSFLADVLMLKPAGIVRSDVDSLYGMNTSIQYYNGICTDHYAASSYDAMEPIAPAFAAMKYYDMSLATAAVAYRGDTFRTFTMGVPFECIRGEQKRRMVMRGIIDFLLK